MSSLGNTVERGGSILVRYGVIVGSWRTGSEVAAVEEHRARALHNFARTVSTANVNHNLAKISCAPSFLFHASAFAFFHISIRL